MSAKHDRTLRAVFDRPVQGGIKWREIESMLKDLGAEIRQAEGSRVTVILKNSVRVFHRPHPSPDTDKGAVSSLSSWLEELGYKP